MRFTELVRRERKTSSSHFVEHEATKVTTSWQRLIRIFSHDKNTGFLLVDRQVKLLYLSLSKIFIVLFYYSLFFKSVGMLEAYLVVTSLCLFLRGTKNKLYK